MNDGVWLCAVGMLVGVVVALAAYLHSYKKSVRRLCKQIEGLLNEDTNLLLMTDFSAREWKELVGLVNQSFLSAKEMKRKMIRANHSFRESITGISHDLRTPLTSAGGFVQMLRDGEPDGEKVKEYLDIVYERVKTVRGLLDQLFDYARMEAEEMELSLERVNLTNLLCDVLSLYYQDFKDKKEEPDVRLPKRDVYVLANEEALRRVLSNVLYNALVHGEGGYVVELEEEEGRVSVSCTNQTSTIREEDIEFLFDRFYTSDKSRNRRTTGLGLAVAKRLLECMGGGAQACLEEKTLTIRLRFIGEGV